MWQNVKQWPLYSSYVKHCMYYVGEMQQALNERMSSHRTDIQQKAEKPVDIQFNTSGHRHEDLQVSYERLCFQDKTVKLVDLLPSQMEEYTPYI